MHRQPPKMKASKGNWKNNPGNDGQTESNMKKKERCGKHNDGNGA